MEKGKSVLIKIKHNDGYTMKTENTIPVIITAY